MIRKVIDLPDIIFNQAGRYTSDVEIGETLGARIPLTQPEGFPDALWVRFWVKTALAGGTTRTLKAWGYHKAEGTTFASQYGLLRYNPTVHALASINTHLGESSADRVHTLLVTRSIDTTDGVQAGAEIPQVWEDYFWLTVTHDYATTDTGLWGLQLILGFK